MAISERTLLSPSSPPSGNSQSPRANVGASTSLNLASASPFVHLPTLICSEHGRFHCPLQQTLTDGDGATGKSSPPASGSAEIPCGPHNDRPSRMHLPPLSVGFQCFRESTELFTHIYALCICMVIANAVFLRHAHLSPFRTGAPGSRNVLLVSASSRQISD